MPNLKTKPSAVRKLKGMANFLYNFVQKTNATDFDGIFILASQLSFFT